MAIRNNNLNFLTPQRRPEPDTVIKGFSTTAARGVFKNFDSPHYKMRNINQGLYQNERSQSDKLKWFQSRATELKEYLIECPKIQKRKIRQIFNWQHERTQEQSEERKLLKELGHKVRGLIKQNNKLKNTIYSGEITELRIENQRLKFLLENIDKGQGSRKKIIIQENQLMKGFIQRQSLQKLQDRRHQNSEFNQSEIQNDLQQKSFGQVQEEDQQKQPLFNATPLSIERLKNLKQYFNMYVKIAIQQNDQRFSYQQKYIDALQKRINQLEKINQKLQQFRFQKRVKLQESQRKVQNFTVKAPSINGDNLYDEDFCFQKDQKLPQIKKSQIVLPVNYYKNKEKTIKIVYSKQELQQEIQRLRSDKSLLKYELQNLQQKYEVQIEKHIRDVSEKQQLMSELSKLTLEKKILQVKIQSKYLE